MELKDVCEYDNGLLVKKGTNFVYGSLTTDGYLRASINGTRYKVHRVIWEILKGPIPEGYHIDHIDGNRCNNVIENLRLATPTQNVANSVGFGKYAKGVKKHGNKFQARIRIKGKYMHLGSYDTEEEASEAYNNKAKEVHGEFAYE